MVSSYHLRQDQAAIGFVRDLVSSGCPAGVICHGPSTLVGAEVAVRALARAQALVRALALARGRGGARALALARARGGVRVLVRVRLVRAWVLVRVRAGTGVRGGRG
jgi:putative intracellular protease/amidase